VRNCSDFNGFVFLMLHSKCFGMVHHKLKRSFIDSGCLCGGRASCFGAYSGLRASQGERRQLHRHPVHPTNQRCWFNASHESAHSAVISFRLSNSGVLSSYAIPGGFVVNLVVSDKFALLKGSLKSRFSVFGLSAFLRVSLWRAYSSRSQFFKDWDTYGLAS